MHCTQRTCNLPVTGLVPDFGMMGTAATPPVRTWTQCPMVCGDFACPITLVEPRCPERLGAAGDERGSGGTSSTGSGPPPARSRPGTIPCNIRPQRDLSAAISRSRPRVRPHALSAWAARFTACLRDFTDANSLNDRMDRGGRRRHPRGARPMPRSASRAPSRPTRPAIARTLAYQARGQERGHRPYFERDRLRQAERSRRALLPLERLPLLHPWLTRRVRDCRLLTPARWSGTSPETSRCPRRFRSSL